MVKAKQPDLRKEPLKYRLRAFVTKPANLILVLFLAVFIALSLAPLVSMLSNMFYVHKGIEKRLYKLPEGSYTFVHFQKLFAKGDWSKVNFWEPEPEKDRRYVTVEDGYFKIDGEIVNFFGVNYMPTSGISEQYGSNF